MNGADAERRFLAERRREVLRHAGIVLKGRVVTLWEVAPDGEAISVAVSGPETSLTHPIKLDLDATLRRWSIPLVQRSRWVGCWLDDRECLCVAPVRAQPPAPPPRGVERRSRERLALELTGLCLGLLDESGGARWSRLPESDALRELSRHPSVIAHEVANPLTASMASLGLCLEAVRESESDPDLRVLLLGDLADVAQGMERAVAYLRSIQDCARGATGPTERFDAVRVLRSCVAVERPLARKQGLQLEWDGSAEPAYVHGDPNALYQVLANLIRNAVDASEGRAAAVGIRVERVAQVLQVEVHDQGQGIAPEILTRVFEPGFTTKAFGSGSGLGLSIVRDLTRRVFGGTVGVVSEQGRGAVFTVTLPIPLQRGASDVGPTTI